MEPFDAAEAARIRRAAIRDRDAFDQLILRYHPPLVDWLRLRLRGDAATADDVSQSAWVRVWEDALTSWAWLLHELVGREMQQSPDEPQKLFWFWLRQHARSRLSAHVRATNRERERVQPLTADPPWRQPAVDDSLDLAELLKGLPEEERAVLLLRLEGHAFKEIGARLGVSEVTAWQRYHDASRRLRGAG